jgi:hypothetical protein
MQLTPKGSRMNSQHKTAMALVLSAMAGVTSAQGLSRAQVQAELQAAIRNGDMMAPGDSGLTERQLNPSAYPPAPVVAGKTRAQVDAELVRAIRNGDMLQASGLRDKDIEPRMYPTDPVLPGKSRAQVESELAMAIRDGDMMAPGDSGMTEYQLHPRFYAHQRTEDASRLAMHDPMTGGGPN